MRKQLEVLEDRLEEMVQPHLSDALSNRRVKSMRLLLVSIPVLHEKITRKMVSRRFNVSTSIE